MLGEESRLRELHPPHLSECSDSLRTVADRCAVVTDIVTLIREFWKLPQVLDAARSLRGFDHTGSTKNY